MSKATKPNSPKSPFYFWNLRTFDAEPQPVKVTRVEPTGVAPGEMVIRFGKYRGHTLNEVNEHDRGYLRWLSKQGGALGAAARQLVGVVASTRAP